MNAGSKSRVVHVRKRGQWYVPGTIVRPVETSSAGIYELPEDPNGGHEVYSCNDAGLDQDPMLRVELRIL